MNSILEFLLDMILDWDDIEDYTQYYRMPVEEQEQRFWEKKTLATFTEGVGPHLWAESQKFYDGPKLGITGVGRYDTVAPVTEEDVYAQELSYRQYQESLEPGPGERAADRAVEADLYRMGY